MKTKNIIKNVLPSLAIMVAGLTGAYLVYQNYFEDKLALQVSTYEPAAGDELDGDLEGSAEGYTETTITLESRVEVVETEGADADNAEAAADENLVEDGLTDGDIVNGGAVTNHNTVTTVESVTVEDEAGVTTIIEETTVEEYDVE